MRAILLYSSMMLLESGGTSTVEDNQEPVTVHNLSAPSGDDQYTAAISAAMTATEARLTATFEAKLTAVETAFDQRASELEAKYEANFAKVEATRRLSVRNDGGIVPTAEISGGRRLSVGDTHLAVPALQLHEFPDGHTCPNTGTKSMRALPHTGSDVTYKPSPQWTASTDNELSLSTIYEDWSTSEIQRMPFPMKVVHEGNCTATPKLELQLSTTVLGSLTVDGYDVGAALRQLGAFPIMDNAAFDTFSGGIGVDSTTGGFRKLSGNAVAWDNYARTSQPITSVSFGCATQTGTTSCNCRFGLVSSTYINSVTNDMTNYAYTMWFHTDGSGETLLEEGASTRTSPQTGFWTAYPSGTGKIMVSGDDVLFYKNGVLLRTASGAAVGKTFYGSVTVLQVDAVAYITEVS